MLSPGTVLTDRFVIKGELGRGGTAIVYLAEDRSLGGEVALKVLHPHFAGEEALRERLGREVRVCRRMKHPNILPVYEIHDAVEPVFLSMAYHPGRTLNEVLLASGPMGTEAVRTLGMEVASALQAAHLQGVLHRDLKPQNLLIDDEGHVQLADFGIARLGDGATMTATGQLLGTPGYVAPEILAGGRWEPRGDLYGLGAVLYQALTGVPPHGGQNPLAVLRAQAEAAPAPPSSLQEGVPPWLDSLVTALLDPRPDARPDGAAAVFSALEERRAPGLGGALEAAERAEPPLPSPGPAAPTPSPGPPQGPQGEGTVAPGPVGLSPSLLRARREEAARHHRRLLFQAQRLREILGSLFKELPEAFLELDRLIEAGDSATLEARYQDLFTEIRTWTQTRHWHLMGPVDERLRALKQVIIGAPGTREEHTVFLHGGRRRRRRRRRVNAITAPNLGPEDAVFIADILRSHALELPERFEASLLRRASEAEGPLPIVGELSLERARALKRDLAGAGYAADISGHRFGPFRLPPQAFIPTAILLIMSVFSMMPFFIPLIVGVVTLLSGLGRPTQGGMISAKGALSEPVVPLELRQEGAEARARAWVKEASQAAGAGRASAPETAPSAPPVKAATAPAPPQGAATGRAGELGGRVAQLAERNRGKVERLRRRLAEDEVLPDVALKDLRARVGEVERVSAGLERGSLTLLESLEDLDEAQLLRDIQTLEQRQRREKTRGEPADGSLTASIADLRMSLTRLQDLESNVSRHMAQLLTLSASLDSMSLLLAQVRLARDMASMEGVTRVVSRMEGDVAAAARILEEDGFGPRGGGETRGREAERAAAQALAAAGVKA